MLYLSASQIRSSHLLECQFSDGKSISRLRAYSWSIWERCKALESQMKAFCLPRCFRLSFCFLLFRFPCKQLNERACKLCKSANHKRDSRTTAMLAPATLGPAPAASCCLRDAMLEAEPKYLCGTYAQQEKANPKNRVFGRFWEVLLEV